MTRPAEARWEQGPAAYAEAHTRKRKPCPCAALLARARRDRRHRSRRPGAKRFAQLLDCRGLTAIVVLSGGLANLPVVERLGQIDCGRCRQGDCLAVGATG